MSNSQTTHAASDAVIENASPVSFQELIEQEIAELETHPDQVCATDELVEQIQEAPQTDETDAHGDRRSFLNRLLLGSAAAAPALLAVNHADARGFGRFPGNYIDLRVLLLLLRNTAHRIPIFFVNLRKHENDHVEFLLGALGGNARPKPTFQNLHQRNFQQFLKVTQDLENTGVGAYLGAAPKIDNPDTLAAAGSIALVEGRHAGTVNFILNDPVVPKNASFDSPLTPAEVGQRAGMFIADLNGGPPIDYSDTPSPQNDIAILNFALALEYLEAEFYNINVPRFLGGICPAARR